MIKTVDRYIGGAAVIGILAVWLALTTLMMMFNLLDQLASLSSRHELIEVFWFVLLTAPRSAYMVFPVSALLGALIGIGGLAATNELVAFRTAGVSRIRISGSALGATLLVTIPVMVMGEWLAPAVERQARAIKQNQVLGQAQVGDTPGIWIRDGREFIHIQRPVLSAATGKTAVELHDVAFYSFAEEPRIKEFTRVRMVTHDGEQWQLEGVRRINVNADGVSKDKLDAQSWQSSVKPELLDSVVTRPRYMSIRALLNQLEYLGQNGLDDRVYRSAFWAKIFFPLTAMSLVLAGMPFVFGSARHNSMGVRIFIGMSLGGLFMIVSRAVQNMGDAYALPAVIAAGAPAVLMMIAVILILRRSA